MFFDEKIKKKEEKSCTRLGGTLLFDVAGAQFEEGIRDVTARGVLEVGGAEGVDLAPGFVDRLPEAPFGIVVIVITVVVSIFVSILWRTIGPADPTWKVPVGSRHGEGRGWLLLLLLLLLVHALPEDRGDAIAVGDGGSRRHDGSKVTKRWNLRGTVD